MPVRSICAYCGSQPGRDPAYVAAGRSLGKSIATHGCDSFTGVAPRVSWVQSHPAFSLARWSGHGHHPRISFVDKEATRHSLGQLNELIITADMHERKHKMFERADAFVTLPGGIGTLEEIVEIKTWAQLGRHGKPMVFRQYRRFLEPDAGIDRSHEGAGLHP